ncbi:MAG TPA: D-aminoacylase [Bacteroidota bacterium]|nr:D-aminoacylase [Bacteroidota bacterium]
MHIGSILALFFWAVQLHAQQFDVLIRNGLIYDGGGSAPFIGDIALLGDSISEINPSTGARAGKVIDASGFAVAPGFINMLSHCEETLLEDGNSQSDIRQGVTLEVLGEGSMGPTTDSLKREWRDAQGDIKYEIPWSTLGGYLEHLRRKGISTNIASFIGAGTVRSNVLGLVNRSPTADELERMKGLVRKAMQEGAMGLTCALIYTPDFYAKTDELIALAKVAAEYGGMYASHIRSEGNQLFEAVDELITISRQAGIPAEIYHLKAAGKSNWWKIDSVISKIEDARTHGLHITADMYTYIAGATGLDASMPPWVQEGGYRAWAARLRSPGIRDSVKKEMTAPTDRWENLYLAAGSPEKVLFVGFRNEKLKPLTGKTLAEVSQMRMRSPEDTMIDLVIEDGSRVATVYFLMTEDNLRKQIARPWVSFCSDAESEAPEGIFLKSNPHPRAYGNFARLLGKYVRDEKVISLEEAVRRLTSLPASNLKILRRGMLKPGFFADLVVFDPASIQDHATFGQPHRYSTGVRHVFVNGVHVLNDGNHTGAKPGRIVRGPGWKE